MVLDIGRAGMLAIDEMMTNRRWRDRLAGKPGEETEYIIEGLGDLANLDYNGGYKSGLHEPVGFASLPAALIWLEQWAQDVDVDGEPVCKIDPEDDRILIWEILPTGHKKVVWHFSGWHWDPDEFDLPQGRLMGHDKSVYAECMANY